MSDKDIAYLGCKIVNGYRFVGFPAIVLPVGFAGEYYLSFEPNVPMDQGIMPWQIGFECKLKQDQPEDTMYISGFPTLEEAVAGLEKEFQVCIIPENRQYLEVFEKEINRKIAHPLKAYFTVNDLSLSGAPSLTLQDDRSTEDYYCFSIWMDDLKIELSWHIVTGSISAINDAENFNTFEEAEQYLQDKHAIRISGEHCSASALKNFKEMHRLLKDIKSA